MKLFKILLKSLLSCLLLLPGIRSMAQVVQPDTAAVDTTGGGSVVPGGGDIIFDPHQHTLQDANGWDVVMPDVQSSGSTVVDGTPTEWNVSALGGATTTVSFRLPAGVGGMVPEVGLVYNSQGGNGIAGMGWSISGLSVITRGARTVWHDGAARGIGYTPDDAFYLDGVRMKFVSGTKGQEGAVYCLENDPFTHIVVHGSFAADYDDTWFEVQLRNGRTLYYGSTSASRQDFATDTANSTAAWYIDRQQDANGNVINYQYAKEDLFLYPSLISYGGNVHVSTGLVNTVTFTYEERSDVLPFRLGPVGGRMGKRLQGVVVKSNGETYRSYGCLYANTSSSAISLLGQIKERNGAGEELNPVWMTWYPQVTHEQAVETAALPEDGDSHIKERSYTATDLNGDGLADLIETRTYTNSDNRKKLMVYLAERGEGGNKVYRGIPQNPIDISTTEDENINEQKYYTLQVGDFNGDGVQDVLLLRRVKSDVNNYMYFNNFQVKQDGETEQIAHPIHDRYLRTSAHPLMVSVDIDNNGKTELVMLETERYTDFTPTCYPLHIVDLDYNNPNAYRLYIPIQLPHHPTHMFSGDFNNNGKTDIIAFYDGGYTILLNSNDTFPFGDTYTNDNQIAGTNVGNYDNIEQGDFNGDGLVDFLLNNIGSNHYYFALNNGDGTFQKVLAHDLSSTHGSQPYCRTVVLDFNHDGKSDVVVERHNKIVWLVSDGNQLIEKHRKYVSALNVLLTTSEVRNLLAADFNGDGSQQLMSLGVNCYDDSPADSINRLYIHSTAGYGVQTAKVQRLIDGFGRSIQYCYASLCDSSVYRRSDSQPYTQARAMTVPLAVVAQTTESNGAAGTATMEYRYEDLLVNHTGRGIIGFGNTTARHMERDILNTTATTWEETFFAPVSRTTTTGPLSATQRPTTTQTFALALQGSGHDRAYFSYPSQTTATDQYGNTTLTTYSYDTQRGLLLSEQTIFDGQQNFYRRVAYNGYAQYGLQWLPSSILRSQQHYQGDAPYSTTTTLAYDSLGRKISETTLAGTDKALTTAYQYDAVGNVLSVMPSAADISTVVQHTQYDATCRFPVRRWTVPASADHTFTYDLWGNLLTETDATDASHPLTTAHTYNGWGQRTLTTHPDGATTAYNAGWSLAAPKRYFTVENPQGRPWTKKWHDSTGRLLEEQTIGLDGRVVSTARAYNNKGEHTSTLTTTGNLSTTETMTYDEWGRLTALTSSTGAERTYQYGNRTTTETLAGQSTTKTVDAWGNCLSVEDADGNIIAYSYHSNGMPSEVETDGDSITLQYDIAGNRIRLRDTDAGITLTAYNALGDVLSQTDARGNVTENSYDALNRLAASTTEGITTAYTYGTSGNAAQRLVGKQRGNMGIAYVYDDMGRVVTETQSIGAEQYVTAYTYDNRGRTAQVTYPGNVTVRRLYTEQGIHRKTLLQTNDGTTALWELQQDNGVLRKERLGTQLTLLTQRDSRGFLTAQQIQKSGASPYANPQTLHALSYAYDGSTGNLTSRQGVNGTEQENFTYDNLDRLTEVYTTTGAGDMETEYDTNGNISYKTDIGSYLYDTQKRHAVAQTSQMPSIGEERRKVQEVTYNPHGMPAFVEEGGNILTLYYGPDNQRWQTTLMTDGAIGKTIRFLGDYEVVDSGGVQREYWYVADGVILYRENPSGSIATGDPTPLYALQDNLGSYLRLYTEDGTEVFSAEYDAWGRQTTRQIAQNALPSTLTAFTFHRGYTGHEMLPAFGLINMNGRLYDPAIARFLSPDNYVQLPDNAQNFNRYSYCLNNPLKYVDPSGEFWHLIIGSVIGGIMNWVCNGSKFNTKGFGYFIVGGIAGALSAGIGFGISSTLPIAGQTAGGFTAGFWGTKTATIATSSFISGALIGGGAGFSGGMIIGVGNSFVNGDRLFTLLGNGLKYALTAGLSGATIGGLWSGFDAMIDGRSFWTGSTIEKEILVQQNIPVVGQAGEYNCVPACAESIDKSFGGNITQQDIRSWMGGDPNQSPVDDLNTWTIYSQKTGHQYGGQKTKFHKSSQDILDNMVSGNRISINLNTGNTGHNVVMQRIIQKKITRINGNVMKKLLYFVMDPARGGSIHRITERSIINAKNVFYIHP